MHRDLQIGLVVAILLHGALHALAGAMPAPQAEERVEMMLARTVNQKIELSKPPPPPPPPPEPKKVEPEPKPEAKKAPKPKPKGKPKKRKPKKSKPKPDKAPAADEPAPLVLSKTYSGGSGDGGVFVQSGEDDILGDPEIEANERNTRPREQVEEKAPVTAEPESEGEDEPKIVIVHAVPKSRCKVNWPEGAPALRRIVEVTLQLTIDRKGKVTRTRVLRSAGEPFDSAARKALKGCTFTPGRRNGRPFVDKVPFVVEFKPGADA